MPIRFLQFFSKGHYSTMGDNSAKKKIRVSYSLIRNPYRKFQDSSFKGSNVTVGIKPVTDERMVTGTSQKQYAPPNFFSKLVA